MQESDFTGENEDSIDGVIDVEGLEQEVLLQYKEYRAQMGLNRCCGFDIQCISKWLPCFARCISAKYFTFLCEKEQELKRVALLILIFIIFVTVTGVLFL